MSENTNQQEERQRIIIVPGMGCVPVRDCNWYAWLEQELEKDPTGRFSVILENMPDPHGARESQWVPFIRDRLKFDEKTILVGHSSGCEAIMRLLEKDKVRGVILVAACHTDLGDENERASEYYNRPWDWDAIRGNTEWIVQFHSPSDKLIPVEEARFVADKLKSEYRELERRGHFMKDSEYKREQASSLLTDSCQDEEVFENDRHRRFEKMRQTRQIQREIDHQVGMIDKLNERKQQEIQKKQKPTTTTTTTPRSYLTSLSSSLSTTSSSVTDRANRGGTATEKYTTTKHTSDGKVY
ncbi:unnamed protein product [Rotaria sordida]|uniref:Uncharacterized protein n=1 Tax=Rotaria sordida TaxID=392033 RepID=A0A818T1G9_9BILA|nr:unnamed protein product [Rotaria sordida]CAF3671186.1 unnamed protein product [Rotaria sordida]